MVRSGTRFIGPSAPLTVLSTTTKSLSSKPFTAKVFVSILMEFETEALTVASNTDGKVHQYFNDRLFDLSGFYLLGGYESDIMKPQ